MRKAFGETILELAEANDNLVLLTGDVEQEMGAFKARWPKRFYNLGMCEQSIISIAAGMALEGLRPVVYSITPFLVERAFEQVKIDIDQQNVPVLLIGYSYYPAHGPTHTPLDWRIIAPSFKNLSCYFPHDAERARTLIREAWEKNGPAFISLTKSK